MKTILLMHLSPRQTDLIKQLISGQEPWLSVLSGPDQVILSKGRE